MFSFTLKQEEITTITLTIEEINYLKGTIQTHKDKELFQPYYSLYRLLRQFVRWIENYEHVYYHGLYKDLAKVYSESSSCGRYSHS